RGLLGGGQGGGCWRGWRGGGLTGKSEFATLRGGVGKLAYRHKTFSAKGLRRPRSEIAFATVPGGYRPRAGHSRGQQLICFCTSGPERRGKKGRPAWGG